MLRTILFVNDLDIFLLKLRRKRTYHHFLCVIFPVSCGSGVVTLRALADPDSKLAKTADYNCHNLDPDVDLDPVGSAFIWVRGSGE